MSTRLPVPVACRELAVLVAEFHGHCHRAFELRPATILRLLERCDSFRRPERFEKFLLACEADARGRTGFEDKPYPQAAFLADALAAANGVSVRELIGGETDGQKIAAAIHAERVAAVTAYRKSVD